MSKSPQSLLYYSFAVLTPWEKPRSKLVGDDLVLRLTDELARAEFAQRTKYKSLHVSFRIERLPGLETIREHYRVVKTLCVQPSIHVGSLEALTVPELRKLFEECLVRAVAEELRNLELDSSGIDRILGEAPSITLAPQPILEVNAGLNELEITIPLSEQFGNTVEVDHIQNIEEQLDIDLRNSGFGRVTGHERGQSQYTILCKLSTKLSRVMSTLRSSLRDIRSVEVNVAFTDRHGERHAVSL